jgi:hypothetical protein
MGLIYEIYKQKVLSYNIVKKEGLKNNWLKRKETNSYRSKG